MMLRHKAANTGHGRVLPKASDLTITFHSVVLQALQRNSLVGTLDLFGLGVDLLLTLLTSSAKTKDQVECGLLLDIVIAQGTTIFQLLSSKDETLLIRRNSFLVLDLGLDIIDTVRWLDVQCDRLTC
jgi:hypothetical protein